ncbi:choline dehydrogenase [Hymenobacter sp. RP-2-7]|uniref:Choline dehydrogenase n=1 Tax=Hymenobacter polaris TaxID=2682546 RepID=A0A7Y0FL28_9BACT|nr:GMC family oxidoreductase N-terminal domain-containing protein [Hymenobacter polaris]NML64407.1 choline dehydrogenase [Hymenobacter polaris]
MKTTSIPTTCDYAIIGAGAAGSVVANRLSANPDVQVVVLEAGDWDWEPDVTNPGGFVELWGSRVDWALPTTPQAGLGGREITINQGKVVGGSTCINAMMYVRGNPANFDQWQALGATGWSYADVLPYFKKIEHYEGGASAYHGDQGEIWVRDCPDEVMRADEFLQGAVELGYDGPRWDYNGERQENGAGFLQFHITPGNERDTSALSFLQPVQQRPNLTLITQAQVTRIVVEHGRAVGVEYLRDGELRRLNVSREVVLSAGALQSPKLLLLSGIGPAAHLQELGIAVQADLPGVGQNLQDHVQLPVIFRSLGTRPMTTLLTGNVLFVKTNPDAPAPDLQLNFTPSIPAPLAPHLPDFGGPVCIFLPILVQPKSVGEVKLASADPLDKPLVNPNYLSDPADLEVFHKALELIRNLAGTAAFAPLNGGELAPGPGDPDGFIRSQGSTLWHPAGTCRMGQDAHAVVDPELRVRGIEGLRVADASVMPTVTSGNTVAACFMIGERAAEMLLRPQPAARPRAAMA